MIRIIIASIHFMKIEERLSGILDHSTNRMMLFIWAGFWHYSMERGYEESF